MGYDLVQLGRTHDIFAIGICWICRPGGTTSSVPFRVLVQVISNFKGQTGNFWMGLVSWQINII
jgi:hypothetical protein